jgi:hypothetical protein
LQVIVTSAGKSYVFNEMLSAWLRIADTGSSVQVSIGFIAIYVGKRKY